MNRNRPHSSKRRVVHLDAMTPPELFDINYVGKAACGHQDSRSRILSTTWMVTCKRCKAIISERSFKAQVA